MVVEPDDLYGLPLDRFIPERAALAKALRAEQRRDDAAAVAALRKPSVAAWAVNQLVRTQGAATQELYDAGDALRAAQSDLLAGTGDARALRAANERERSAVDALVQTARGLLDADGHELSAAIVERVGETLHAAALDEEAREQVRGGRLERELRHVGLGLGESAFAAAAPAPAKAPRRPARKERAAPQESREEKAARERAERERTAEAKRAERERAQARKAARAAETAARRRAERSTHALRAAQERRDRAARALAEADASLAAAQAEADEAAQAHRDAQAELERP